MPKLKQISPHLSIFSTVAFNFATKGGQLVLWEMCLVIEFPSGSCVLIPSATVTHSNIPVAPGGFRTSFTQYAPGGLFAMSIMAFV